MKRITRPPPHEVRTNQPWLDCRKATYVASERDEPEDSLCPFHPEWVGSGVRRIDAIADDFFKYRSPSAQEHAAAFGQGPIEAFWTEACVMSIYQDICACTLGILREQLDVASTLQTKVIGVIAAAALTFANLFFVTYVKPELESL